MQPSVPILHQPPRLLWYGNTYFAKSLSAQGWEIDIKHQNQPSAVSWQELFQDLPRWPDILVVGDFSGPPPLLDPHTCPCLTVLYSVDSHIHSWHPLYAQAFDLSLVSLKDNIPLFIGAHLDATRILWSPLFAHDDLQAEPGKTIWDTLFVGKVDELLTPKRFATLKVLSTHLPDLQVRQGNYRKLYPQAKVVLNFCDHGDFNFRVFEALACGSALLTPRIGHGLTDLFTHGDDLWLYETGESPTDVKDLLKQIRHLLASPEVRKRISRNGQAKINNAHRAKHRAMSFTQWLRGHSQADLLAKRQRSSATMYRDILRPLFLHLSEILPYSSPLRDTYYHAGLTNNTIQKDSRNNGL